MIKSQKEILKNFLLFQPRGIVKQLYSEALWNFSREEKNIYLTFDDGPVPGLTEWVLEELSKFNAKATFFCVGENIIKYPEIFSRIKAEGHLAANHTMFHSKGFKKTVSEYIAEAEACRQLVGNHFFRPPYGQLKRAQYRELKEKGYKIVFWDVISYDYEKISEKTCERKVIRNTKNGSIVLFHDNVKAEKNLKHALPLFLKHFSSMGYAFKTLANEKSFTA